MSRDVDRNVGNFCRVPLWNTTMSATEVEYMFETYSNPIFCNGRARNITVDRITDNCFKVYTEAV
jgi:hypothetical protein